MTASVYTLGCKTNQFESQAMERLLADRGCTIVPWGGAADICIINTCTVTSTGDRKSRSAISAARRHNPAAVVAVCGCYTQLGGEAAAIAAGADIATGNRDHEAFIDNVIAVANSKLSAQPDGTTVQSSRRLQPGSLSGRTRALLKIQNGCENFCTYCIVPYARGPSRSLSLDDVAQQARSLYTSGFREIVLTGIEISSYADGEHAIVDAVETVCRSAPDARIRLGSLEPRIVDEEFVRRLAALDNLCEHFHLSLQSGCDRVLARMGRKYDTVRYTQSLSLLRGTFAGANITTDLIVGFPGETDEEFYQSIDYIRRCRFGKMHIFPYSRREGTPAADMAGQVAHEIKRERARIAAETAAVMRSAYLSEQIGNIAEVLTETPHNGRGQGLCGRYVKVILDQDMSAGRLVNAQITEAAGDTVYGKLV